MNLANKIAKQRRTKRLREVLRKLRLSFYEYEGGPKFGKYQKLVKRIEKAVKS